MSCCVQAVSSLSPVLIIVVVVATAAGSQLSLTAPAGHDVADCLQHIQCLQLTDDPALFGLHANAATASNVHEGKRLLADVLSMQCSKTAGPFVSVTCAGASATAELPQQQAVGAADGTAVMPPPAMAFEVQMAGVISQLVAQLPQRLDTADASILHNPLAALPGGGRMHPLGVVLLQEVDR